MKRRIVKKLFWLFNGLVATCFVSGTILGQMHDPSSSLSKQNLNNVTWLSNYELPPPPPPGVTVAAPSLRETIDLNGQTLRAWISKEKAKKSWEIITDCCASVGGLQQSIIKSLEFMNEDRGLVIQITLVEPYTFQDGLNHWQGTLKLANVAHDGLIKPALVWSIDLQGEKTIEQWIDREQGSEPTKNLAKKFNDLFLDKDSLLISQIDSITLSQNPNNQASAHVLLKLKDGSFSDHSTTMSGDISLKNILVNDVSFNDSVDAQSQPLANWIFLMNQDKANAISTLVKNPNSLPVQIVDHVEVLKIANQTVSVSLQLKDGFVFSNKQKTVAGQITLTNLGTKLKNPVFKKNIDLKNQQTISQWIVNENKKIISEKLADLCVRQQTAVLAEQVNQINLSEKSDDQVEVVIKLKDAYSFDGGGNQISAKISLTNPKKAKASATTAILVIVVNVVVLILLIGGFSAIVSKYKRHKTNFAKARSDEQSPTHLPAQSTLTAEQAAATDQPTEQRVNEFSKPTSAIKIKPKMPSAACPSPGGVRPQPSRTINVNHPAPKGDNE